MIGAVADARRPTRQRQFWGALAVVVVAVVLLLTRDDGSQGPAASPTTAGQSVGTSGSRPDVEYPGASTVPGAVTDTVSRERAGSRDRTGSRQGAGNVVTVPGFDVVDVATLPPEVDETLALIAAGGPFPYRQDGAVFQNREGILPDRPPGYYHEYTVETPGSDDRGARRIVTGDGGETFYTDDHYDSFRVLAP